ncbi:hypothetical protein STEG23_026214 [Scotinomys teguina]
MDLAADWRLDNKVVAQTPDAIWPLVATWTIKINIDLCCGRTMNPDMVLSSSLCLIVTMASGEGPHHHHGPSSSMNPGSKHGPRRQPRLPNYRNQHGTGWQQEPWTSTQTLLTVGPGTQTQPLAAAWPRRQQG